MLRWYGHKRRVGEEKVVTKVTEWRPDEKSKRKTEKPVGGTGIRGRKKAKNSQLEGEGSGLKRITKEAKTSKVLEQETRKM